MTQAHSKEPPSLLVTLLPPTSTEFASTIWMAVTWCDKSETTSSAGGGLDTEGETPSRNDTPDKDPKDLVSKSVLFAKVIIFLDRF